MWEISKSLASGIIMYALYQAFPFYNSVTLSSLSQLPARHHLQCLLAIRKDRINRYCKVYSVAARTHLGQVNRLPRALGLEPGCQPPQDVGKRLKQAIRVDIIHLVQWRVAMHLTGELAARANGLICYVQVSMKWHISSHGVWLRSQCLRADDVYCFEIILTLPFLQRQIFVRTSQCCWTLEMGA